jgi:hypothetical protein
MDDMDISKESEIPGQCIHISYSLPFLTWVVGVTPWLGTEGKVEELQANMYQHEREEESTVGRFVRRKLFYAALQR